MLVGGARLHQGAHEGGQVHHRTEPSRHVVVNLSTHMHTKSQNNPPPPQSGELATATADSCLSWTICASSMRCST